jgi:NADP-dependent 3-hydroxy acid dehydrogenase YdfG
MEHSIALITGATSGLGHAADRSLARVQETAAQLAAEIKRQVFTSLELDLNAPASVQCAVTELVKRGRRVDFLLLNVGMVPGKKRVLTAAGVEAAKAKLSGHHQLTIGLLHSPSN